MFKAKTSVRLLASAIAFAGTSVFAADSELGTSSTDSVALTASINKVVRINNLADSYPFGALTPGAGTNAVSGASALSFCVYSNSGLYSIRADGGSPDDGTNGNFAMESSTDDVANTDQLEYHVDFDDNASFVTAAVDNMLNGTVYDNTDAGFVASTTDNSCGGGANASLQVTILSAEIDAASPDSYDDTLILTVAPI